jgi:nucleotide-binding universal stress UspA family protein
MSDLRQFQFQPAKMMVPVDFSSSSESALSAARGLAHHFQSEIFLLHVVPALPDLICAPYFSEERVVHQMKEQAEVRLTTRVAELTRVGLRVSAAVEVGNDVAGHILQAARREHVDLLVLSTHGMSGWRPVVFGSIAEKVMKLAACPVLLLRSLELGNEWLPAGDAHTSQTVPALA